MRAPIDFVYGNCVFAAGAQDCWAAFVVETASYAWLSDEAKHSRLVSLMGAIETLEADVQILRVGRSCTTDTDQPGAPDMSVPDAPHGGGGRARRAYLEEHRRRLRELDSVTPVVFLLISLREPARDIATYVSQVAARHPGEWWRELRQGFSMRNRRLLGAAELERARVRADQAHARLVDYLPARPARGIELQWLIRRGFCRGLGEPLVDGLHEPRALAFERNGEAVLAPLEGDVMRWADSHIEHRGRSLRIESEL
ncbi:MAG TPA: hypothetical protein VII03_02290, partial [Solirubrobacteraceae bacterium]